MEKEGERKRGRKGKYCKVMEAGRSKGTHLNNRAKAENGKTSDQCASPASKWQTGTRQVEPNPDREAESGRGAMSSSSRRRCGTEQCGGHGWY